MTDKQRIAELEQALRPFAMYAMQQEHAWRKKSPQSVYYGPKRENARQLKYQDFFDAIAAMEGRT